MGKEGKKKISFVKRQRPRTESQLNSGKDPQKIQSFALTCSFKELLPEIPDPVLQAIK
jgi:hypothetical protein